MKYIFRLIFAISSFVLLSSSALASIERGNTLMNNNSLNINTKSYRQGELLVKFKKTTRNDGEQKLAARIGAKKIKRFGNGKNKSSSLADWAVASIDEKDDVEQKVALLKKNPDVEYAEPNYQVEVQAIPNDPRFSELWGMNNIGQTGGLADADIDAVEAWDKSKGSESIIVAVIDTGIDYTHEDLNANMWRNPGEIPGNGIDDDGNGYIDDVYGYDFANKDGEPFDDHGHGTHCAGIIAAVGNNGIGVAGVNWNAKLMALKFLGAGGTGYISAAISAINYATRMGARVMSNSWGGPGYSQALFDAILSANEAGIAFVAAAGNTDANIDRSPTYPASYTTSNMIAVAATDHTDARAIFSSFGAASVHLGAPGVNILSTVPTNNCTLCDPSGYRLLSGTSMATPHVASAIALFWARFPNVPLSSLKERLINTVDPIPSLAGMTVSGGRLNINSFLNAVNYDSALLPFSQTTKLGTTREYTLSLTSRSNNSESFTLVPDKIAPEIDVVLSTNSVTVAPKNNVSIKISVSISEKAPTGSFPIRVRIRSSDGTVSVVESTIEILATDYEVSISPSLKYLTLGRSETYQVKLRSIDEFSGNVLLHATTDDSSLVITFDQSSLFVSGNSEIATTMTVSSGPQSIPGVHKITVSATNRIATRTASASIDIREIDLLANSVVINSPKISIGKMIEISDSIANQGRSNTIVGFSINYYLSKDPEITSTDYFLGRRFITSLGSGQVNSVSSTFGPVGYLEPGKYYLGAIVDADNTASEVDEANNVYQGIQYDTTSTAMVCNQGCQFNSINDALGAIQPNEVVVVGDGTYREMVIINSGKGVYSQNGPTKTIIDVTGLGTGAVNLTSGTISGFTIMGGRGYYAGGVEIWWSGEVSNNIIRDNAAPSSGGLMIGANTNAIVRNNQFINNRATSSNLSMSKGGAIGHYGKTSEISGNIFFQNSANYGGAIYLIPNFAATTNVRSNSFKDNTAAYGGAIFTPGGGYQSYDRNIFEANSATVFGGAIACSGAVEIKNSLITKNSAPSGAGVSISGNYCALVNSTVTNNTSGVFFGNYSTSTVKNSIVRGNLASDIVLGSYAAPKIDYSILGSDVFGATNKNIDPRFVDSISGNYHLRPDSPAIDSGSKYDVATDLDGVARPQDGDGLGGGSTGDGSDYDIGAYEFMPQPNNTIQQINY